MYPENDELCASIISEVIAKTNTITKTNDDNDGESRSASSTVDITRDRNQIYALRQKMEEIKNCA